MFGQNTAPVAAPAAPEVVTTDPEQEAADLVLALLSGTGSLRQRLASRAFLLTVLGFLPSVLAGVGELQKLLPPFYALPIYGASFLLVVVYLAVSRYENVGTAKAAATVLAARSLAAPKGR